MIKHSFVCANAGVCVSQELGVFKLLLVLLRTSVNPSVECGALEDKSTLEILMEHCNINSRETEQRYYTNIG